MPFSTTNLATHPQAERPRRNIAMGLSVGLHGLFLFGLAWLASSDDAGTVTTDNVRSVAMAIVHRTPDRTKYVTEPSPPENAMTAENSTASSSSASGSAAPPTDAERVIDPARPAIASPLDLDAIVQAMISESTRASEAIDSDQRPHPLGSAGAGDALDGIVDGRIRLGDGRTGDQLGDEELVPGRAKAGSGAGRTTTQVFGVSGSGSTFVYVFDRSESMKAAGGAPLRASKSELIRSLDTLTERQQFQIIFYNDQAEVFRPDGDRTGLVLGEEGTIARAKEFVRRTTAIGGTEHETALRLALRLAPDVIFFLTDAKIQTMSAEQLDEINRRAESAGTTIHAIQFGTGPMSGESFVRRLASQNKGGYRYVDVTELE